MDGHRPVAGRLPRGEPQRGALPLRTRARCRRRPGPGAVVGRSRARARRPGDVLPAALRAHGADGTGLERGRRGRTAGRVRPGGAGIASGTDAGHRGRSGRRGTASPLVVRAAIPGTNSLGLLVVEAADPLSPALAECSPASPVLLPASCPSVSRTWPPPDGRTGDEHAGAHHRPGPRSL